MSDQEDRKKSGRALQREWDNRLRAEGMPPELALIPLAVKVARNTDWLPAGTPLAREIEKIHVRAEIAQHALGVLAEYFWSVTEWENDLHREIVELYAIERISIRKIAARLGIAKSHIGRIVARYRYLATGEIPE